MSPAPASCSVEWLCEHAGIARVHPRPGGRVGDPFTWSATLARLGDTVAIKGVDRPLTPTEARALLAGLAAAGVRHRIHTRGPAGRFRHRPIPRPDP